MAPAAHLAVPGVVLAGGAARRMGGADKPLLDLGGRPVIAHVIARLGCAAAISANGPARRFAAFGLPVLPDSLPGLPGPLAGVLAGLDWAADGGAAAIVTAAADTPFFPADLAARLAACAAETGAPIVLARAAAGAEGPRLHPTFGWWSVQVRGPLRAALLAGHRRVAPWAEAEGAVPLDVPGADPFFNINTPADLGAARARLRRLSGAAAASGPQSASERIGDGTALSGGRCEGDNGRVSRSERPSNGDA